MPSATYVTSLAVGGVTLQPPPVVRTGDHPNPYEVALPAGKAGTLGTRTDDDSGVATLAAGHGITTGNVVDVYWSGGRRYGMAATVAGNDVTLEGGAGDNLPPADTAVVVTRQVTINTAIAGNSIVIIGVMLESLDASAVGHISFFDSEDNEIVALDLARNDPDVCDVAGGATNKYAGAPITYAQATCGSSSQAGTLKIASLEDSTP